MSRIANVNVPANKRLVISLTYIYGIGSSVARDICQNVGIEPCVRVSNLTEAELQKLRAYIAKHHTVEGDLKRIVNLNIKKKKDIKCYQGSRHIARLPVRGQRTHTNARTRKGKAVAIAGKKKATK